MPTRNSSSPPVLLTRPRVTQGAGLQRWGHRLNLRTRSAAATRRASEPSAAFARHPCAWIHRQQRLPDRAASASSRMMAGETAALSTMPEHVRKLLGAYEGGLRGYHLLPEAPAGRGRLQALPGSVNRRFRDPAGRTPATAFGPHAGGRIVTGAAAARGTGRAKALFPEARLDRDLQQVVARPQLPGVSSCTRLPRWNCSSAARQRRRAVHPQRPPPSRSCSRTPGRSKRIVNVSAVEGSSTRRFRPPAIRTPTWPRPRST